MYAIYVASLNRYFLKDHSKVTVFDDPNEAAQFANAFYNNYAIPQGMQMVMEDPSIMGEIINAQSSTTIEPLPENHSMETVNFNELRKNR